MRGEIDFVDNPKNVLTESVKNAKISADNKWLLCPICGQKVMKLLPSTTATNLPIYCKRCKQETVMNITQSQSLRARAD